MNKLTAEKCREHIARLKRYEMESLYQFPFEIDMREAFEIALPILEQQERGDVWIEWGGGECPIPDCTIVEVRFRSGRQRRGDKAEEYIWTNGYGELSETGADIIAYRIIPENSDEN